MQVDFTSFFEKFNLGMALIDPSGKIMQANQALLDMLGYRSEELAGLTLDNLTYPGDLSQVQGLPNPTRQEAPPDQPGNDPTLLSQEKCFQRKDGSRVWGWINSTLLNDASGQVLFTLSMIEDTTMRRQANELLQIQRNLAVALSIKIKLPEALDQIIAALCSFEGIHGAAIYLYDQDNNQMVMTIQKGLPPAYTQHLQQFGLDSAMGLLLKSGQSFSSRFTESQHRAIHDPWLGEGLRSSIILPVVHQGQLIASINLASRSMDEFPRHIQNAFEAIAAQTGDIITHIQAEETLQLSQQNLSSLFESQEDFIFILDEKAKIIAFNPVAPNRLGYSTHELHKKNIFLLHPPERHAEADEVFQKMLAGSETISTIPLVTRHGTLIPVETRINRGVWNQQAVIFAVSRDISDRLRAEQALRASEIRFKTLFERASVGISLLNLSGRMLDCNPAFLKITGFTLAELRRAQPSDYTHPDDIQPDLSLLNELFAGKRDQYQLEKRFIRKDGNVVRVNLIRTLVRDFTGRPEFVFHMIEDITERFIASQKLQEANLQLTNSMVELEHRHSESVLLNQMGDMLQSCLVVEEVYRTLAQFGPRLFEPHKGALFILDTSQKQADAVCTWGGELKTQKSFPVGLCWALRRGRRHSFLVENDQIICQHLDAPPFSYQCMPLVAQDQMLGLFYVEDDHLNLEIHSELVATVAERIALALANLRLSEALRIQAYRDPLTNLYNRRYMEEVLEREVARAHRRQRTVCVVLVDIDDFKKYNTRFYLDGGDAMLTALGQFLTSHIRQDDVACRYGGDEFVLILPEANLDDALHRAESLRLEAKNLQVQHRGQLLGSITLSIGVAAFPDHAANVEDLLHAANVAAFNAKTLGSDQVLMATVNPDPSPQ